MFFDFIRLFLCIKLFVFMLRFVQNNQLRIITKKPKAKHYKSAKLLKLGLLVLVVLSALVYFSSQENKNERIIRIKAENDEKFKKDSARLNDCVQYVLLASDSGFYPCYSCEDSTQIFLNKNEVWYYGETCYEEERYTKNFYAEKKLIFRSQYFGSKYDVLIAQKKKIYEYILLTENVSRFIPLIRPPGNKRSN